MATSVPSIDQLKRALELSEQIERFQSELREVLGGEAGPGPVESNSAADGPTIEAPKKRGRKKGRKRSLSPEAIQKIREGQKKRWAKIKKGA